MTDRFYSLYSCYFEASVNKEWDVGGPDMGMQREMASKATDMSKGY